MHEKLTKSITKNYPGVSALTSPGEEVRPERRRRRNCRICHKRLSIYNRSDRCFHHGWKAGALTASLRFDTRRK